MRLHCTIERKQKYKCFILGKTKTITAELFKFNIIYHNIFSESLVWENCISYLIIVTQLVINIILMSSLKIIKKKYKLLYYSNFFIICRF